MTKNQQLLAKMGGGSLALLLSLSLGQQASATTLVSNLPPTTLETNGGAVKFDQWVSSSFTTGSGIYGYTLDSVTLRFREDTADNNLSVSLYTDNFGGIGGLITSFTKPSFVTNTIDNYPFTLTTPQTLASGTTYWLVAGISSNLVGGEYSWRITDSAAQTGLSGWSIGDSSLFSSNQGLTWNSFPGSVVFQFSVDGTVNTSPPPPTNIPEPGSIVALLGLAGLGLASRLKKLSTRA